MSMHADRAPLSVATRIDERRGVVEVAGDVDVYTAAELRAAIKDVQGRAERAHVVVVLDDLTFMDSTGLGLLVAAHKRAVVAQGRVALVGTRENLLRVLRITGLDRLMPSFGDIDAAFAWLDLQDGPQLAAPVGRWGDLVRYRASNGILPAVELTEAEAREDFDHAQHVTGTFGGRFVVCPVGEMGHVLTVAATTYEPIKEAPKRPRRRSTRP